MLFLGNRSDPRKGIHMRRSFTIELIPDLFDEDQATLFVKTIDVAENGLWYDAKMWLEVPVPCNSTDVKNEDTLDMIVTLAYAAIAEIEARIDANDNATVRGTDAHSLEA